MKLSNEQIRALVWLVFPIELKRQIRQATFRSLEKRGFVCFGKGTPNLTPFGVEFTCRLLNECGLPPIEAIQ